MWPALVALVLVQDTGEEYYKFPKGTTWTYKKLVGQVETKVVSTVVKEEKDKVTIESKEYAQDGAVESRTFVWYVEEKHLLLAELKDERLRNEMRVYKFGSKKGDTWKSPVGGVDYGLDVTHRGKGDVTVPAGTYKDALEIRMTFGAILEGAYLDVRLAPGVGLVRFHFKAGEEAETRMDLADFKRGK